MPSVDPIVINCANCNRQFNVAGKPAGGKFKCSCQNQITVPSKRITPRPDITHCSNCWKAYNVAGKPVGGRFKCASCGQPLTVVQAQESAQPSPAPAGKVSPTRFSEARDDDAFQVEDLEREIRGLSAELEQMKNRVKLQQDQRTELSDQAADQRLQIKSAMKTVRQRDQEIANLKEQARRQTDEAKETADKSQTQGEQLERRLNETEEALNQERSIVAELRAELEFRVSPEEAARFRSERGGFEAQMKTASGGVSSARHALARLVKPMSEVIEQFQALQNQAGEIDFPDFLQELDDAHKQAQAAADRQEAKETELAGAEKQLAESRADAERQRQDTAEQIERLHAYNQDMAVTVERELGGGLFLRQYRVIRDLFALLFGLVGRLFPKSEPESDEQPPEKEEAPADDKSEPESDELPPEKEDAPADDKSEPESDEQLPEKEDTPKAEEADK